MVEVIFNTNGVRTTLHGSQNKTVFTEETNAASKLECTIYYGDESFLNIFPGLTDVIAYDTFTNDVIFEGTVYSAVPTQDQSGAPYVKATCAHLISKLSTACVVGFEDISGNLGNMVQRILGIYNATAPEKYQILFGTAPAGGHPEAVHLASATCFEAIKKLVVEESGWEFRTRYHDGHWYLDISPDFGMFSPTDIITGVNMLSISRTIDSSELYTRIIPIGGASYIPSDKVNPAMSTLQNSEGMPLTLYGFDPENPGKIYIANEELEKKYPIMAKIVQFDDIKATDDTDFDREQWNLHVAGIYEVEKLTDIIEAYSVTAIDLSRAGYDYDAIEMNRMYHIINDKLDINTYLKVTSRKIDYGNPAKSELTFGDISKRSTKWLSNRNVSIYDRTSNVARAAYTTLNTRMDSLSMRNTNRSEYDGMQSHDARTLYVVKPNQTRGLTRSSNSNKIKLYLGDDEIGGSGEGWVVEYATVLNDGNYTDFVVNTSTIVDINAHTSVKYGAIPSGIIVNGQYTIFNTNANTVISSQYQQVIDNREYFGLKLEYDVVAIASSTPSITWGKGIITYEISLDRLNYNPSSSNAKYYYYYNINSKFVDATHTYADRTYSSTFYLYGNNPVEDIFLVPVIGNISDNSTYQGVSIDHGYVYTTNSGAVLLVFVKYANSQTYVVAQSLTLNSAVGNTPVLLLSEDEHDFDFGISQRTEPVGPGGGS